MRTIDPRQLLLVTLADRLEHPRRHVCDYRAFRRDSRKFSDATPSRVPASPPSQSTGAPQLDRDVPHRARRRHRRPLRAGIEPHGVRARGLVAAARPPGRAGSRRVPSSRRTKARAADLSAQSCPRRPEPAPTPPRTPSCGGSRLAATGPRRSPAGPRGRPPRRSRRRRLRD